MQVDVRYEHFDVVVIGAGQAGLSVGYHLRRLGLSFVILEANARVGDSWRHRWDSLRLFTPAQYDGIVGLPFPAARHSFPTKDDMANYLERYASHFDLPVRTGVRVQRLSRNGAKYQIDTDHGHIEANHVVVAMASYQEPRVPAFSRELSPHMVQIHSREYRSPAQLNDGPVLVVGAGNSGAEIAMELARSHRVVLSGRDTGHVPFRMDSAIGRMLVPVLFRIVFHRILTVRTPIGRKMRATAISQGTPLIRVKPRDLAAAGVERVGRVAGVSGGRPRLADGQRLDVANVVWCTGFTPGFGWIDLPVLDADGEPRHDGGLVAEEPGLYFVGLHFLYSLSSTMIQGVSRDAERIALAIEQRIGATQRSSAAAQPYAPSYSA